MDAPELYCLTFGAEPASGLGQSSTADQPWMAHGGNSMGPFEWSYIYIRWEAFSTNFKMGHVERPLNWNIRKFSIIADYLGGWRLARFRGEILGETGLGKVDIQS